MYNYQKYRAFEFLNLCFNLSVIVVLPPPETAAIEIILFYYPLYPPKPFINII